MTFFSFAGEKKQTMKDLFNHFAEIGYYSELLRLCTYLEQDSKSEILLETLHLLQREKCDSMPLVRDAWKINGPKLIQSAQARYEKEKKDDPQLAELGAAKNNFAPLSYQSYYVLQSLKTFNTWISEK